MTAGDAAEGGGTGAARRALASVVPWTSAVARHLGRAVLDLVYPPHCLGCSDATQGAGGLCGACWRTLPFVTRPYCERLGTPFAQDLGPGLLSPEAIAHPPAFARSRGVVLYGEGPARRLVHRLKYGDRHEVAALMGGLMARAAAELVADGPVLVPMPLHRGRLLKRQFNQAALLAAAMARATGLSLDLDLLRRIKPTRPQVGMSRRQRASNVQGAFALAPGSVVEGRDILLVDDVMTTGATADAAARALLRAGARRVDLMVFALVVGQEPTVVAGHEPGVVAGQGSIAI